MQTLNEFNKLNADEQQEVILSGTYLADREENGLIMRLYGLGTIYGEVFYNAHTNRVLRVRAFDTTANWCFISRISNSVYHDHY